MHHLCKQTWLIGFVMLSTVAALRLSTPMGAAADDHPANGAFLDEVSFVCTERYRPESASRPWETNFPVTGPPPPATLAIRLLLVEEEGIVRLQVPAALLTALQTSGRKSPSVELQVPAALLTILQTEGHVKLP